MTVLIVLLGVAAVTWLYRVSFTALFADDRLPTAIRSRMDAVGPAAFAALLATHVAGVETGQRSGVVLAVLAAVVAAHLTRSHLVAVLAAAGTWWVLAAW
jgi:branched-subunit amino acid transport protein